MELLSKIPVPVLLTLSACSVCWGDFFAKAWSVQRGTLWYLLAIAGYIGSGLFYIPTLLSRGLLVTSTFWAIGSGIGLLIIGWVIYHENLSATQWIGVLLGLLAALFLEV